MSKQKVFSTDNTIHYNDYIKIKGGNEYLKSIKFNSDNKIINKFKSYQEFITLSKSFYNKSTSNYLDNDACTIYATQNLYNANVSYNDSICYLEKENSCSSKQILYPCGIYKDTPKSNMYFPYKINIDKWCINNGKCYQDLETCSEKNCNCKKKTEESIQKKCKTGLCKNAKPLFI